ncbi:tRNA pseudouridine(55) synthase TruB [Arcanobacterium phocisimile]|nr:tRNA pseudouridine(55) synthase TruB [Arcanobacterium phocisimile]
MARNRKQMPDRPRRIMPWGDLPRGGHEAADGLILIDKPQGVTSHDIVGAMRRLGATRKVGHTGTLDPMATGLLTVAFGRATKLVQYLTGADKTYLARIVIGVGTDSDDADGTAIVPSAEQSARVGQITAADIDSVMAELTGPIQQVPATVSAKKIGGKRAHDLVRDGHDVELAAQSVTIHSFDRTSDVVAQTHQMDGLSFPVLTFDVSVAVSSGTYIRALARDLGEKLGVGAHLTMLRRTQVGKWDIGDAYTVEALRELIVGEQSLPIVGIDAVCAQTFSRISVTAQEAERLGRGLFIERRDPERIAGANKWPACAFLGEQAVAIVSPRSKQLKPDLQIRI